MFVNESEITKTDDYSTWFHNRFGSGWKGKIERKKIKKQKICKIELFKLIKKIRKWLNKLWKLNSFKSKKKKKREKTFEVQAMKVSWLTLFFTCDR